MRTLVLLVLLAFATSTWAGAADRVALPRLQSCRQLLAANPLSTTRTTLRLMRPQDFAVLHAIGTNPVSLRNMNVRVPAEVADEFLNNYLHENLLGESEESLYLVIADRQTDQPIGDLVLTREKDSTEVGIGLHPQYWGQGLGPEALRQAADYAFSQMGATRLLAKVSAANKASQRMVTKTGFVDSGKRVPFIQIDPSITPVDSENSELILYYLEKPTP